MTNAVTTAPAEPEEAPAPPPSKRDAIIVLGGLRQSAGTAMVDLMAQRLARALDHNAEDGTATFALQEAKEEDYREANKCRVVTVSRKDAAGERPVADLYELRYGDPLTAAYRRRPPIVQALNIGWLLLLKLPMLLASVTKKSKTPSEKFHVLYGGFLFLLLAAYVPVLLATVAATVQQAIADTDAVATPPAAQSGTPAQPAPRTSAKTALVDRLVGLSQLLVVIGAAVGLFRRGSVKEALSETAATMVPALAYLDQDARAGLVRGQFQALLEHLAEKAPTGTTYERVHVIGYSFGSLVALDGLFPINPPGRRIGSIDTLVTVGCPFDFVRTYWDDYYTGRRALTGVPRRWLNIYTSLDVLSSDFKDTTGAEEGVRLEAGAGTNALVRPHDSVRLGRDRPLSLSQPLDYLSLIGFTAHGHYWEGKEVFDTNCFDIIASDLYKGRPALA